MGPNGPADLIRIWSPPSLGAQVRGYAVPFSLMATSRVKRTRASWTGRKPGRPCNPWRLEGLQSRYDPHACAAEETFTMRVGALDLSLSRRRLVRRNGAR